MDGEFEQPGPSYWDIADVEYLERYQEGGFHPVHIGDELHHGRYKIVHKLGYGSFSTVWLVQDRHKDQYVALKIAAADAGRERTEIHMLQRLGLLRDSVGGGSGHPGRNFVSEMLDEFEIQGPNGKHQCIALEPLGASLSIAYENLEGYRLPSEVSKKVAMQLAEGLSYLHACGIVHGGRLSSDPIPLAIPDLKPETLTRKIDLHDGNILFRLPSVRHWTAEQVYSCFGRPEVIQISRRDGLPLGPHAPKYAVCLPPPKKLLSLCLTDASISIVDFGESFLSTICIPKQLPTPTWFAAPEVLFHDLVGPPSDVWALACLLFHVFGRRELFQSYNGNRDEILLEMVCTFGKLPSRWWQQWEKRKDYFGEDGIANPGNRRTSGVDLQAKLKSLTRDAIGGLEAEELAAFECVLLGMLTFEPSKRLSAEGVVQILPRVCGIGSSPM